MGDIHGCKIAIGAPVITHLFFADDCYLFFRATLREAKCIKECLILYERASGQQVNLQKSSISFSRNTMETERVAVSQVLQATARSNEMYLGLPKTVSSNRWETFRYVKEKVWNRLQSWKGITLSRGGKEILLKSVVQSIPSYVAGMFLLPAKLCQDIEVLMNKFWWLSDVEKNQGIRWMSWDRMCVPKKFGGMGFKRIREFNLAMLGKQAWRILTNPDTFIARLLKARYFPRSEFGQARIGNNPSYVWRSIMAAQQMVCNGTVRRIGNGESVNIWKDQ